MDEVFSGSADGAAGRITAGRESKSESRINGYSNEGKLLFPPMKKEIHIGILGWCSSLAPAFGPGRDPGDPGSNPTSGSRCMEPASRSACVSDSLSLSLYAYHK